MILISVTITSCLAFIIVSFFYYFAHSEIKKRTIDSFQMQSRLIDRELERLFFERIGDIESLAGRIRLLNEKNDSTFVELFLIQTRNTFQIYDNLYFLDSENTIIASTKDNKFQKIFNPLLELSKKNPVTLFSLSDNGNILTFVKSIKHINGKNLGYLIAEVPIAYITEKIHQVSIKGKYNYLEEIELRRANGQILYSQNKKKDHAIDLTKTGFQEDDEYMWTTTSSLETGGINKDQNWTLVVRAPKNEVYKEAIRVALILFFICTICIIIFAFFSERLFTILARPIELASKAVIAAGEGNFDAINLLKATEDELGDLIKSLQTMNKKITQLLSDLNVSLAETKHQLELRDEFIAIVAHELRTPLTPVSFQMQFLRRLILKEKFKGHPFEGDLEKIQFISLRQLKKINQLIDSLLEVSRINLGQFTYHFVPESNLSETIDKIIKRIKEENKIEIIAKFPALLTCTFDPDKMDIVIYNLLSNAIHSGEGRKIEIEAYSKDTKSIFISVKDHGIGIRPEDMDRIFKRFERGVSFRNYGGIGLGLYLSRKIVEDHGGRIWAESTPNVSTTFFVELPKIMNRQMEQ